MKLEVKRTYLPTGTAINGEWEVSAFDRTVWSFDDGRNKTTINNDRVPEGFYEGLLSCYVDGHKVTLDAFDKLLRQLGCIPRTEIRKLIE